MRDSHAGLPIVQPVPRAHVPEPLDAAPPVSRRPRHVGRWTAVVVASLLLHLTALDLLPHWNLEATDRPVDGERLQARLVPAITPAEVAKTEAPRAVAPHPAAKPKPAPHRSPPPVFVPEALEPAQEIAVAPPQPQPMASPIGTVQPGPAAGAGETPVVAASAPAAAPPEAPAPVPAASTPLPDAVAPRSARLEYKVLYIDTKNNNPVHYYGVGSIDWAIDDGHYRSELVAAVDFLLFKVNVLASHSEGTVTASGLAPDRYTETPRKRATVATSFNRDARQNISFSASQAVAPLLPGAQDRLSVLFQIGALLLAGNAAPAPQTRIDIPVAGVRGDVEIWRFEVQGDEAIDAGRSTLSTTHLRRAARAGSNDRTIDVWIAAHDGGYPVRVLYTEPDGSTIEMTLDRIATVR